MKNLILRGIVVGPVQTNCYFLKNKETAEILIVPRKNGLKLPLQNWAGSRRGSF